MRCAICFAASVHGRRRPETGRRIFGRWLNFTRNCSAEAALPEAERDFAGAEAQPKTHTVSPLIVVLEIAAIVLAGVEAEYGVSGARHLTAGTQVDRISTVFAEHVAHRERPVVAGSRRNRPVAYTRIVISDAGGGRRRSQEQPVSGIEPVRSVQEDRAPGHNLGEPKSYVRDDVRLIRHALGGGYPDQRGDGRVDGHGVDEYVLISGYAADSR